MERQSGIGSSMLSRICLLAAFTVLVGAQSFAARPTQAELSDSALHAAIGPVSRAVLDDRVGAAKERLRRKEAEHPTEVSYATTVFRSGMSESDLERFAESHGVEIARAEAKIPVDDEGTVFTVSIGSREILLRDGTFGERLRNAMGHQRVEFYDSAQTATDAAEKQRFMAAARARPILYYKIECVGQNRALAELSHEENVAVVFVREGTSDVLSYNNFKQLFASWRRDTPPPIRVRGRLERPPSDPKIDPSAPVRRTP